MPSAPVRHRSANRCQRAARLNRLSRVKRVTVPDECIINAPNIDKRILINNAVIQKRKSDVKRNKRGCKLYCGFHRRKKSQLVICLTELYAFYILQD